MIEISEIQELLTEYGIDGTVRTYPSKSFDAPTNTTTLGAPVDYTIKMVPPYQVVDQFNTEFITGGKGKTGFANDSLAFTVEQGLTLIIDGVTWLVTGVSPIRTGSGIVYYELEIESS
jgi:hypothetical protein